MSSLTRSLASTSLAGTVGRGGGVWLMDGPPAQSDSALQRPFVNRRFNIYL